MAYKKDALLEIVRARKAEHEAGLAKTYEKISENNAVKREERKEQHKKVKKTYDRVGELLKADLLDDEAWKEIDDLSWDRNRHFRDPWWSVERELTKKIKYLEARIIEVNNVIDLLEASDSEVISVETVKTLGIVRWLRV